MTAPYEQVRMRILREELRATSGNVFVCVRDHFSQCEYDFSKETKTSLSKELAQWAVERPERTIVLFTALEELDRELGDTPGIKIVRLGGDITNHHDGYITVEPVLDKNLNSDRWFVSLNRNARFHRVAMVSMLYAMNLDQYGYITFLDYKFFRHDDFLDHVGWVFSPEHTEARKMFIDGFPVMKSIYGVNHNAYDEVYGEATNHNVDNFNLKLREIYRNCFIEIVSETTVAEPAFLLTEKTLNSIYGCNFPIIISGQGAVKLLREMGMDVFDDIIDHSYDEINDPILRMHQAIALNKSLLTNGSLVKDLWCKNRQRFINNVAFAKEGLYNYYIHRAKEDFCQAIDDINK